MCLEINLKDNRYANIIESSLSKQAMTVNIAGKNVICCLYLFYIQSFVFEDEEDYNYFLFETHDTRKWRVNAVQIKTKLSNYNPLISNDEVRKR